MDTITTKGFVLRQNNYGEADRILTIFTQNLGIITAIAKGARKYKSHQGQASSIFCYSEFTLCPGKNMYVLRGASLVNSFYNISTSLEKLSLASFFCEITSYFVPEEAPENEILNFLLNTMYILSEKERDLFLMKSVYEIKVLSMLGYEIEVNNCVLCQSEEVCCFAAESGGLLCKKCGGGMLEIPSSVITALRYILMYDASKIYSFTMDKNNISLLSGLADDFLIYISERSFKSLEYFKTVCQL